MLGDCVGEAVVPVELAVGEGLGPELEVEVLPTWVVAELATEVLPPSPALWGSFIGA